MGGRRVRTKWASRSTIVGIITATTLLLSCLVSEQPVVAQAAGPSPTPASLWAPPPGVIPSASSYLYLASFGGTVGNGAERTFDSATSLFSMTGAATNQTLTVTGYERWQVQLVTPAGMSKWLPGYYSGLDDSSPTAGRMDVTGNSEGCDPGSAWLLVEEVHYTADTLDRFKARFEQDCLDAPSTALRGEVLWDASTLPPPSVPPQAIPSDLWSPPPGSTPTSGNFIYVDHPPGPMGGGYPTLYADFAAQTMNEGVFQFDGAQTVVGSVQGEFGAGSASRLTVGYYPTRTSYPFQPAGPGGFNISASRFVGSTNPCEDPRGWFAIDDIAYTGNQISQIAVRWLERCDQENTSISGALKWSVTDQPADLSGFNADPTEPAPGRTLTITAARDGSGPLLAGENAALQAIVREEGQPVTSGHVWFLIGGRLQGSANLDSTGSAHFTASELRGGSASLVAVYQTLDGTYVRSAPAPLSVEPATPVVEVVAYPANAAPGALTYVTVRVPSRLGGAPVPQGDIEIRYDGVRLGKVSLVTSGYHRSSDLTIAGIPSGRHRITAAYLGDLANPAWANFTAASATTTVTRDLPTAAQRYVNRLYETLLGRIADPAGLRHWSAKLEGGGARKQVAQALTNGSEFRRAIIVSRFPHYFSRAATAAEITRYLTKMRGGLTFIALNVDLVNTHTYFVKKRDDRFWLYSVYSEFLGRDMTAAQNRDYLALIAAGVTKRAIATSLATSTRSVTRTVASYDTILLGRSPRTTDPAYVGALQRGGRDEDVIAAIVASDEFFRAAVAPPSPSSHQIASLGAAEPVTLSGP